ncbi:MAG: hypothetical protein FXF47_03505 [Candidatus Mcinerneyibacterium aminivorans]|uniref:Peptidase C39-like domain-containing protein n=1 Tax=Candidatus Mcinerneyibacterium aminivorans TaxID=2703815 RepID=A0A5D0MID5_9BACT|nr:MAG: hypothetical protein FXF47_03505 [Candidatus Mcinerneyibacterium aminivorans]
MFSLPPQAPFGNWNDTRQAAGCEEASAVMAMNWVYNSNLTKNNALIQIIAISNFEHNNYGSFYDTSAEDTVKRIFKAYFSYTNVKIKPVLDQKSIIYELNKNRIIIVPVNGQKLNNPYFTPPGPKRHMLLIIGWNKISQYFITNDPGTKRGRNFKYKKDILYDAIRNYETGNNIPIKDTKKVMIVVKR